MDQVGNSTPSIDLPSALGKDYDLFCPECDYNLKGLVETRCPECGFTFSRDALVIWATERAVHPLMHPDGRFTSWGALFLDSLINPVRLARRLPTWPDIRPLRGYAWAMRAIATGIAMLAGLPIGSGGGGVLFVLIVFSLFLGITCGAALAEHTVAGMLNLAVRPRCLPHPWWGQWLGLSKCFAGHLVLHASVFVLLLIALILLPEPLAGPAPPGPWVLLLLLACPGVPLLWWSLCLARAVQARGKESTSLVVPLLGILLTGALTSFIGVVLGLFVAYVLSAPLISFFE